MSASLGVVSLSTDTGAATNTYRWADIRAAFLVNGPDIYAVSLEGLFTAACVELAAGTSAEVTSPALCTSHPLTRRQALLHIDIVPAFSSQSVAATS